MAPQRRERAYEVHSQGVPSDSCERKNDLINNKNKKAMQKTSGE